MNSKNIFGAFTVAIALFFLWPGVFSSWEEMGALKATLANDRGVLTERTGIFAKAQQEYGKYQTIAQSEAGRSFSALIPEKKDTAELVSAAQAMATTAGLQLTKLQVVEAAVKTTEQYATMALVIEMSGQYSGLRSFLGDLEEYVRILNIKSLKAASDEHGGSMKFVIRADTYYIK